MMAIEDKSLTPDWIECVVVREINISPDKACPVTPESVGCFGAKLGGSFEKWAHFDSRQVSVPAANLEPFKETFRKGGWHICQFE